MRRTLALVALLSTAALAVEPARARAQPGTHDYRRAGDYGWFLLGGLAGFVAHESSHLLIDGVLRARPTFEPVRLGRIPFFAIQPNRVRSERAAYAIAAMGFLGEAVYSEVILSRRPNLVVDHEPLLEGMLAFHGGLDVGYAVTGLLDVGPPQSDVMAMSRAARIPSWSVALMLLAPVAFDAVRYARPEDAWAVWASRGSRLVLFGSVFCFRSRRLPDAAQATRWRSPG